MKMDIKKTQKNVLILQSAYAHFTSCKTAYFLQYVDGRRQS